MQVNPDGSGRVSTTFLEQYTGRDLANSATGIWMQSAAFSVDNDLPAGTLSAFYGHQIGFGSSDAGQLMGMAVRYGDSFYRESWQVASLFGSTGEAIQKLTILPSVPDHLQQRCYWRVWASG